MKRVGILTLPFRANYGALLQAFALRRVLSDLGYDAWLVKRRWDAHDSAFRRLAKVVFRHVVIGKFYRFMVCHVSPQTHFIDSQDAMRRAAEGFDAFVVGSDQVWRMRNVRGIGYNFFLDFLPDESPVKRVAYAASFGVDYWDDTKPEESISVVKRLLQRFDGISVRESGGVKICKNTFGVDAIQVLDPTLLLPKEVYIEEMGLKVKEGKYIAAYILDMTENKRKLIASISQRMGLSVRYINKSKLTCNKLPVSIREGLQPSVKSWLEGICNALFVITDSFHGTAFSIIFERQFLSIGNTHRGLDRFTSLLDVIGHRERLVDEQCEEWKEASIIDYGEVNEKKTHEIKKSLKFIKSNI